MGNVVCNGVPKCGQRQRGGGPKVFQNWNPGEEWLVSTVGENQVWGVGKGLQGTGQLYKYGVYKKRVKK